MTQEFHISVTLVEQNGYLVRTEQVAPGVPLAEEVVTLSVADWLTQSEQLLQGNVNAPTQFNLIILGQQIYSAIFQGTLQESWMTAQKIAQQQQEVLRLRLGLKETRLGYLPWEVLHTGDRFLATHPNITFSRYQVDPTRLVVPTPSLPENVVKVLMAMVDPTEQNSLALKQEATRLQTECLNSIDIQFTILEQPGRSQLQQALEQGKYQILLAIPSSISIRGEYLVSDKTGLTETLSKDALAQLLVNNGIQMVVFSSCQSAYADPGISSLIQSLVKRGIKSVLAIRRSIPDEVLLTFIRLFYSNLSQGYPVDFSLNRARQGLISAYGSEQLYWALPILYLQPEYDGYLTIGETAVIECVMSDKSGEGVEEVNDDSINEEDSAVVSELFRQVANPGSTADINQLPETVPSSLPPANIIPRRVKLVSSIVGAFAIAVLGLWSFQNLERQQKIPPTPVIARTKVNLKTASTLDLQAIAIEQYNKGNLSYGCLAVEELLNRNELQRASAALATLLKQADNEPQISFLKGQLAWQYVKSGDKNYSLDDARRYWEIAVKLKPDSAVYHNALGFAYYAQGNLNQANQELFQALYLGDKQQALNATAPSVAKRNTLNAYAGLAIVLSKSAATQPTDQQAKLLRKAIKLRQKVLTDDPVNFQPQTLSKKWLWTEKAVQDWRSLATQANKRGVRE